LKGSARQRYTEIIGPKPETIDAAITRRRHERRNNMPPSEAPVCHQTLLDDNLMETTNGRPVALRFQSRRYFNAAVTNDTTFLAMVDVVDYSIIVGINDDNHSMIVGIIDYLRKYDILKRLERGGKLVANLVAGQAESTIIPPKDYQRRFTAAMDRYFTIVPDKWNKNKIDKN
jgi:1-phosphatidylinositol-3-phosphate 5-kinase